ncbi:TetR/AcrR family transcriptional regulator [Pelagicoccus albus]|uniref:TetR/AcrR family transcriptional regulator n=1 Tax=Pelagicoccus albus TaxID=415222 RepID=A0A7X1B3R7_9BACT|nr:TetR/AcrR family transcriptional regulator [Pelagicoccus albus]MBC2605096.1 TetR/AcrR family transcriptional regulator [Pelagicoccus albus]
MVSDTVNVEGEALDLGCLGLEELGLGQPADLMQRESEVRRRILGAALPLFANQGFDSTPVDQIISDSEASPSTLYRQFENKEGLLNCLYSIAHAEFAEYVSVEAGEIWRDISFYEVLRRGVAYGMYRPNRYKILFVRNFTGILREENLKVSELFRQGSLEILKLGQEKRFIREGDVQMLDSVIRGGINNTLQQFAENRIELTRTNFDFLVRMIWDAIRF